MNCQFVIPLLFILACVFPLYFTVLTFLNDFKSDFARTLTILSFIIFILFFIILPPDSIDDSLNLYLDFCLRNFTFF